MRGEKIFFKVRNWDEETLAKRIAAMLNVDDWVGYDAAARKWQIGRANNFWLHPIGDRTYSLNCRMVEPRERAALSIMLQWRLHVELIEEK